MKRRKGQGNKMKKVFIAVLVASSPFPALAKEIEIREYRWIPKAWNPLPYLVTAAVDASFNGPNPDAPPTSVALGPLVPGQSVLKSKGEMIETGQQKIGPALIDDTWTQTVFTPGGHVLYAAGSVIDELPKETWLAKLRQLEGEKATILKRAEEQSADYRNASRKLPPDLRLRKTATGLEAYWRIEFVNRQEDRPLYLELSEKGELLKQAEMEHPGADGRAYAFPLGPKFSSLTDVPLYDLSGDGTLTGRKMKVESALGLDVKMPDLRFFFQETDRRLDLAQVYFSIQQSARWLKEKLGAEFKSPLTVRLHVGDKGVSNAAFYHNNMIYLGTGDGVVYRDITRDPSIIIHESIHALIDAYSGLPSDGEGGSYNEGFADLFTALILKNPRMGESSYLGAPYRRTLENNLKAYKDFQAGVYQNGSIIAGTFWDMRKVLSDDKLATLAFKTLVRLGKGGKFADFVPALTNAGSSVLSSDEMEKVMEIVRERGWVTVR